MVRPIELTLTKASRDVNAASADAARSTRRASALSAERGLTARGGAGYDGAVKLEAPAVERTVQCPQCGRRVRWSGNMHRPFCSLACRLIDLGAWIDERHRIPGAALDDEENLPAHPSRSG